MAFTTNHKNTGSNLMEPGEYELLITDAFETATNGGTPYVSVKSVVRNDVEQKYQNKPIFDSLWLTEGAAPYTERKINSIDKVLGMPEATYAGYDDWGNAIRGRAIRAKITHSKAKPGYDPREQVSFYMGTRYPDVKHVFKDPVPTHDYKSAAAAPTTPAGRPASAGFTPVSDDDLPF